MFQLVVGSTFQDCFTLKVDCACASDVCVCQVVKDGDCTAAGVYTHSAECFFFFMWEKEHLAENIH
jgi:hypothetical protein